MTKLGKTAGSEGRRKAPLAIPAESKRESTVRTKPNREVTLDRLRRGGGRQER